MASPLDWNQVATLIGLAGIVSGGVSAGINYVIERRKERDKIKAEVVKEQIELYSAFIYNLTILIAAWKSCSILVPQPIQNKTKVEAARKYMKDITEKIDSIVANKIHFLEMTLWANWSQVRQSLELAGFETANTQTLSDLQELVKVSNYEFENAITRYEKLGIELKRVDVDKLVREVGDVVAKAISTAI
jgi:hypothetical protein